MMGPPPAGDAAVTPAEPGGRKKGPSPLPSGEKPPSKFSPAIPSPISRRAAWGRAGSALPRRSGPVSLLFPAKPRSHPAARLGSLFSFFSIFFPSLKEQNSCPQRLAAARAAGGADPPTFRSPGRGPTVPATPAGEGTEPSDWGNRVELEVGEAWGERGRAVMLCVCPFLAGYSSRC